MDEYGYEHSGEFHVGHKYRDCYDDRQNGYRTNAPPHLVKPDEFGYKHLIHSGMHVDHPGYVCKLAYQLGRQVTKADIDAQTQQSSSDNPKPSTGGGLSVWAIILIVMGSIFGALLVAFLILVIKRHRKVGKGSSMAVKHATKVSSNNRKGQTAK